MYCQRIAMAVVSASCASFGYRQRITLCRQHRGSKAATVIHSCAVLCITLAIFSVQGCAKRAGKDDVVDPPIPVYSVYPLAGKVLVDGHPPVGSGIVIVMLYQRGLGRDMQRWAKCDKEGRFVFTSYRTGDGVRAGRYVVVIAQLERRQGQHKFIEYVGPDKLNNIYNDPDVNERIAEFNIVHAAPGKDDYVFDLKVKANAQVKSPGKDALTEIRF